MAGMYEFRKLLGSGTFGQAWLSEHKETGKKLVVKQVKVSGLSSKELEQTLTEVSALATCRHANIIKYKEAFVEMKMLNIVMEYAEQGDLYKKIQAQQGIHFHKDVILDWFVQLSFAIRHMHSRHILHRDLKTQNIFVTNHNIVKVGDFGIAKVLNNTLDKAMTAIGTPHYLSPEICQKQPYNQASDMWALGCVVYELCCLHVPFSAPDLTQLMMAITQGQYHPIPSHFGPILEDIVSHLLNVEPCERPTAEQLLCITSMLQYVDTYVERYRDLRSRSETGSTPTAEDHHPVIRKDKRGNIVKIGADTPPTPTRPEQKRGNQQRTPPRRPDVDQIKMQSAVTPKSNRSIRSKRSASDSDCPGMPGKEETPAFNLCKNLLRKRAQSVCVSGMQANKQSPMFFQSASRAPMPVSEQMTPWSLKKSKVSKKPIIPACMKPKLLLPEMSLLEWDDKDATSRDEECSVFREDDRPDHSGLASPTLASPALPSPGLPSPGLPSYGLPSPMQKENFLDRMSLQDRLDRHSDSGLETDIIQEEDEEEIKSPMPIQKVPLQCSPVRINTKTYTVKASIDMTTSQTNRINKALYDSCQDDTIKVTVDRMLHYLEQRCGKARADHMITRLSTSLESKMPYDKMIQGWDDEQLCLFPVVLQVVLLESIV